MVGCLNATSCCRTRVPLSKAPKPRPSTYTGVAEVRDLSEASGLAVTRCNAAEKVILETVGPHLPTCSSFAATLSAPQARRTRLRFVTVQGGRTSGAGRSAGQRCERQARGHPRRNDRPQCFNGMRVVIVKQQDIARLHAGTFNVRRDGRSLAPGAHRWTRRGRRDNVDRAGSEHGLHARLRTTTVRWGSPEFGKNVVRTTACRSPLPATLSCAGCTGAGPAAGLALECIG